MTSAEPCRRAPYSVDLRWRVVWQRIGMECSHRKIASNLSISVGTVYNIYSKFVESGDVAPNKQPKREALHSLSPFEELLVLGLIIDCPGYYLSELCEAIDEVCGKIVSPSTVCKIIHKHGFTRKKLQQVAKQRSVAFRGHFMAEIQMYPRDCFVFVDETGCSSKDHIRKFGYAMRGDTAIDHRFFHRGKRVSAIAAISSAGLIAVELTTNSVNGDKFFDFVRGSLIPEMQPFDGHSPCSIVVLDNCSIHHIDPVTELFRNAGILTLYLPPYSPDYMPIEEAFSYIKYYLKDHDQVWQTMSNPTPLIQAAFDSITDSQCKAWISDCGYQ